jgi:hypothetical protein
MTVYILITLAEVEPTHPSYSLRRAEYMMCLHKLLNYKYPTVLIKSETERINKSCIHDILDKFTYIHDIPNTNNLGAVGKSQQEYVSIQSFIHTNPIIDDDAWIVKLSGRYLLIDDTFMNEVNTAPKEIQGIVKIINNNTQIHTFCYALRYKWFKTFYKYPLHYLGYKNIETFILDQIRRENLLGVVKNLSHIGILTNVNNEDRYLVV